MREKSSERPFFFGIEVFEKILRIHTARREHSTLIPHLLQQPLPAFVDEGNVRQVNKAFAPVHLVLRLLPTRSKLGDPWSGQLSAQSPSLLRRRA
jgi:hypothetical protein